jgi:hypothetical protein
MIYMLNQDKCLFFQHIHGWSGDGGATRQRSQVMAHPQLRESSPAIPGVSQLFLEVQPGLQDDGRLFVQMNLVPSGVWKFLSRINQTCGGLQFIF